jgi:hypothetical protein
VARLERHAELTLRVCRERFSCSLVTRKVAFGSGAALGFSDPALIGPGRIGLTMTLPCIPVSATLFDWP